MSSYHEPAEPVHEDFCDLRPFTAEDLENLTGIPRRLWWSAHRKKALPSIQINRKVLFPRPALLRILAEGNLPLLLAAKKEGNADA